MSTVQARFRLRLYKGALIAIGPGKVALLEAVASTGSISAAARACGMSYRRAWQLIDEMNQALRQPAVVSATGGSRGGGSQVTATGEALLARYRAIEAAATAAAAADIAALGELLAQDPQHTPGQDDRSVSDA